MPAAYPSRRDDEVLLKILDRIDGDSLSFAEAGEPFGKSRSSVSGMVKRVRDAEIPCACEIKENQNGGMGRKWWAK